MAYFNPQNDFERNKAIALFKNILETGKRFKLEVVRNKRTVKQNAYLHVCIDLYGCEVGLSREEAKTFLKRECHFMMYVKEIKGKDVKFLKRTSELNTKEMTDFIEWLRTFASQQNIYIPSANEYLEQQHEIHKHIDQHKSHM